MRGLATEMKRLRKMGVGFKILFVVGLTLLAGLLLEDRIMIRGAREHVLDLALGDAAFHNRIVESNLISLMHSGVANTSAGATHELIEAAREDIRSKYGEQIRDLRLIHGPRFVETLADPKIAAEYKFDPRELPQNENERRALRGETVSEIDESKSSATSILPIRFQNQCLTCHNAKAGDVAAALLTTVNLDSYLATFETIKKRNRLLSLATGFLLLFLLFFLLHRLIVRPLATVRKMAGDIASSGDLSQRISLSAHDEIGDLIASFNRMAENLEASTVSSRFADNVFDSITEMLIVANPDGTIRFINRSVTDTLGYLPLDLVGETLPLLWKGKSAVPPSKFDFSQIKLGHPIENTFLHKDGRWIPVSTSYWAIRNQKGEIEGYTCIARGR